MKTYRLTVKHDKGKTNFQVKAKNEQSARHLLCIAENCPDSAIIKVKELKK